MTAFKFINQSPVTYLVDPSNNRRFLCDCTIDGLVKDQEIIEVHYTYKDKSGEERRRSFYAMKQKGKWVEAFKGKWSQETGVFVFFTYSEALEADLKKVLNRAEYR